MDSDPARTTKLQKSVFWAPIENLCASEAANKPEEWAKMIKTLL